MARRSRMSVLKRQREAQKRQRERRKAEKAALKRERRHGKKPGMLLKAQYALAHKLVFSKLHAKLGGKLRFAISGGAALPKAIGEFFQAAGIILLEGYGLTETAPVLAVNPIERPRYGSVGHILPGVTVGDKVRRTSQSCGAALPVTTIGSTDTRLSATISIGTTPNVPGGSNGCTGSPAGRWITVEVSPSVTISIGDPRKNTCPLNESDPV